MARETHEISDFHAHAGGPASTPPITSEACDDYLQRVAPALHGSLHSILGWADRLPRRSPNEVEVDRAASVLIRQAHQQSWMLNELMSVWRTTPGTVRLDLVPVVFADVVDKALWAAQPVAHAAGIRVARQVEPSAYQPVVADVKRLTQAFLMLMCHAMTVAPRGGIMIVQASCAHGLADLCVADHGPADAAHAAGPMAEYAAGPNETANGLGLAFVRDVVTLHRGQFVTHVGHTGGDLMCHLRIPVASEVSGDTA